MFPYREKIGEVPKMLPFYEGDKRTNVILSTWGIELGALATEFGRFLRLSVILSGAGGVFFGMFEREKQRKTKE
jgi:hypothetical protein